MTEALGRALNDVESKNAPVALYGAGRWELLRGAPRVSIVGSRKATPEGWLLAVSLSAALCRRGVVVLSGLAEGIDTAAHTTAIRHGGDTIGVLGTPLSQSYPAKNRELQRHMMAEQLVISQFREGVRTSRADFPRRNRTMALLADATVIIEAQDKSGSLHQGWEALRLGRPLYIMQRSVIDPDLSWPAELLRYGARALAADDWDSLIDELPEPLPDYATFTF